MNEPHWRKRRREAMERKRTPGFYGKTAGKGFDYMAEGTSFWGHKGLQRRYGKVGGEKGGVVSVRLLAARVCSRL